MKSSPCMKNVADVVEKMKNVAFNANLIGTEITPAYVSYYCGVSPKFASFMIQYWEGAGKPVATE